jgi:catechol 2,3-dioxygenase-like lactoylglutathione lyase family enzyme
MESKTKVVPIFRIFDYKKAIEFYVEWLGFKIDWEHKFDENSPVYMQVSRDGIVLHLSEHHGDCTPGSKAYITIGDVRAYHKEISGKDYKYNKPGIEMAPWNAPCIELVDPFSNKLLITEEVNQ